MHPADDHLHQSNTHATTPDSDIQRNDNSLQEHIPIKSTTTLTYNETATSLHTLLQHILSI